MTIQDLLTIKDISTVLKNTRENSKQERSPKFKEYLVQAQQKQAQDNASVAQAQAQDKQTNGKKCIKCGVIIPGGSLCESCAKKLMQGGSNNTIKGVRPVVPPKMPIIKGVRPLPFTSPFEEDEKEKEKENNNLSDEQKAEIINKGAKAIDDILKGD